MRRRLDAWRQPGSQATGSRSPENNGHSQKRMLAIAALRRRPGSNLALCNRSSAAGAMESWKTGSAGARHSTRSFPKAREWDRFSSTPFPRR